MKIPMKFRALLLLLPLAACGSSPDPFDRELTWSIPAGNANANDANLRTMVVDPRDLAAGAGEDNSAGNAAAAPVRRLITGRRTPLPQSNTSAIGNAGSQSSAAPTATGNAQSQ